MTDWINYHHLYYFKTIAEEGSVSAAAKKLHIGQPTLSAQLKHLEDSMGLSLFERQHKRLVLTEQGKVALEYARNIFKLGSEMSEALHDRLKPSKTSLCIGTPDNIPKHLILELVKAALDTSPCQITLLEGKPEELFRELSAHRVDLLLSNFIPTGVESKGFLHRVITKKNVGIYGAARFKKLKSQFPESISGQPMIVPTYDSKLRYDLDHWSATQDIQLDILLESQDIGVKKLMATNSLGLLPTATHSVDDLLKSNQIFEIGILKGVYEEIHLITAQRKVENPLAKSLMQKFKI